MNSLTNVLLVSFLCLLLSPVTASPDTPERGTVQTGIDVLEAGGFAPLAGLRIGLITNHTGLDSAGRYTLDVLHTAPGVKLTAVFSPEHGLSGTTNGPIATALDPATGLPVYSLYGDARRPSAEMLDGVDALVFDIQDAGVRFYTYITTMGYAMEAAAEKRIAFYVLDRPNPLTGSIVQGPVMDGDLRSFTGYFPLPVRHGMTVGELAQMFSKENGMAVDLHVITMRGYRRTDWYDETGLRWIPPSPNLRTLAAATLYPGVAMVEGANVSVGRGTDTPFELLGAPWIEGKRLALYLNSREVPGVRFTPVEFTPTSSRFASRVCRGVRIVLLDRRTLDPTALGVEIASALSKLYPGTFQIDRMADLIASRSLLQAIKEGQEPRSIVLDWGERLKQFIELRSKYLLY